MEKMNNEPLKVGDLAYVFRSCRYCGDAGDIGHVIKVLEIQQRPGIITCCFHVDDSPVAVYDLYTSRAKYLWGLKKIPPLDELDSLIVKEELETHE